MTIQRKIEYFIDFLIKKCNQKAFLIIRPNNGDSFLIQFAPIENKRKMLMEFTVDEDFTEDQIQKIEYWGFTIDDTSGNYQKLIVWDFKNLTQIILELTNRILKEIFQFSDSDQLNYELCPDGIESQYDQDIIDGCIDKNQKKIFRIFKMLDLLTTVGYPDGFFVIRPDIESNYFIQFCNDEEENQFRMEVSSNRYIAPPFQLTKQKIDIIHQFNLKIGESGNFELIFNIKSKENLQPISKFIFKLLVDIFGYNSETGLIYEFSEDGEDSKSFTDDEEINFEEEQDDEEESDNEDEESDEEVDDDEECDEEQDDDENDLSDENILIKLQKIAKVSKCMEIKQLAKLLHMNEDQLMEKLIDWALQFGYIIEQDIVVFQPK
jgi:hypothetical protein